MDIVQILIDEAFNEVNSKYIGLPYHNINHTKFVVDSATAMAQKAYSAGKIGQDAVDLIAIAAAYHDIEQGLGPGQNEQASANIAASRMQNSGIFNSDSIQIVIDCIMATVVNDYKKLTQSANQYLPTQIVADADLATFGSPFEQYLTHANNYYKELYPGQPLSGQNYYNYLLLQQQLLGSHKFYTAEATQIFRFQADNLGRINQLIANFKVE